jgi:hypothetical protein
MACSLSVLSMDLRRELTAAEPELGTLDRIYGGILKQELSKASAASCATAGCHGGPRPGVANPYASRSSEYQLWLENDPHAQSWRTICSEQSIQMMEQLRIIENGEIVNREQFNNCLACHNSTPLESSADLEVTGQDNPRWHAEGVGCTGCHGPTQTWSTTHYAANWHPGNSSDSGFVPAGDLLARARMCASCHVGDRDRDMNHDIIAAGHPALRFDMATYHNRLPKHWRDAEAGDKGRYEAQLWAAGAIASADAWLSLQQGRAEHANAASTWPEFSAYDCSSCHHALSLNSSRNPLSDTNQLGVAKQSTWDTFSLKQLLESQPMDATYVSDQQTDVIDGLNDVRRLLESSSTPDRESVAEAVSKTRTALSNWAAPFGFQPYRNFEPISITRTYESGQLLNLVKQTTDQDTAYESWESASQLYLMTIASKHSWPTSRYRDLVQQTQLARNGLSLPRNLDSPQYSVRSPIGPQATAEELRLLMEHFVRTLEPATTDAMRESTTNATTMLKPNQNTLRAN